MPRQHGCNWLNRWPRPTAPVPDGTRSASGYSKVDISLVKVISPEAPVESQKIKAVLNRLAFGEMLQAIEQSEVAAS